MGKFSFARAVCTPQYAVSGISRLPIESVSVRVGRFWLVGIWFVEVGELRGREAVLGVAEAFGSVIVISESHIFRADRSWLRQVRTGGLFPEMKRDRSVGSVPFAARFVPSITEVADRLVDTVQDPCRQVAHPAK